MNHSLVEQAIKTLKSGTTNKHKRAAIANLDVVRLEELRDGLVKLLRIVAVSKGHNDNIKTKPDGKEVLNVLKFEGPNTTSLIERNKMKKLINLTAETSNMLRIFPAYSLKIDYALLIAIDKRIKRINRLIKLMRTLSKEPPKPSKARNIDLMNPNRINKLVRIIGLLYNALIQSGKLGILSSTVNNARIFSGTDESRQFIQEQISKKKLTYTWDVNSEEKDGYLSYFPSMATSGGSTLLDSIVYSGLMSDDMIVSIFSTIFSAVHPDATHSTNYNVAVLKEFILDNIVAPTQNMSDRGLLDRQVLMGVLDGNYNTNNSFMDMYARVGVDSPKYANENIKRRGYVSAKYLTKNTSIITPSDSVNLSTYKLGDILQKDNSEVLGIFVSVSIEKKRNDYTHLQLGYTINSPGIKVHISSDNTLTPKQGAIKLVKGLPSSVKRVAGERSSNVFRNLQEVTQFLVHQQNPSSFYVAMFFENSNDFSSPIYEGTNISNNLPNARFKIVYKDEWSKTIDIAKEVKTGVTNSFKVKNIVNILLDADISMFRQLNSFNHIYIVPENTDTGLDFKVHVVGFEPYRVISDSNTLSELYSKKLGAEEELRKLAVLGPKELIQQYKYASPTIQVLYFGDYQIVSTNLAIERNKSTLSGNNARVYAMAF